MPPFQRRVTKGPKTRAQKTKNRPIRPRTWRERNPIFTDDDQDRIPEYPSPISAQYLREHQNNRLPTEDEDLDADEYESEVEEEVEEEWEQDGTKPICFRGSKNKVEPKVDGAEKESGGLKSCDTKGSR
jgi:hypothetical protein